MNKNSFYLIAFTLFFTSLPFNVWAREDKDFILRLEGNWKFCIGDNMEWASPEFDDNEWESIKVPSAWEDQGFYGYDGYAWYRTSFNYSKDFKNKELYLHLGYIDDVDEVYVNGHLIGISGSFPPQFSNALEAKRKYLIPEEYLSTTGKNIISVRVYNHQMAGGILSGEIGITATSLRPDFSLSGVWLFRVGDNKYWKELDYKDKQWKKIVVPSNWENQGYNNHNGFAWYRKHFNIPQDFPAQKVTLVIGNICHYEEVYINGKLVGSTGKMPGQKNDTENEEPRKKCRIYTIPENLLRSNKQNTIAIRVYNVDHRGGIVEGPVGLFKSATFIKYSKEFTEE